VLVVRLQALGVDHALTRQTQKEVDAVLVEKAKAKK
jgi:hypothetical protein